MRLDDLPLFAWTPPRKVIPFPASLRIGHARKVAVQLSKARTQREADFVLTRALETNYRQLLAAGVEHEEADRQTNDFVVAITAACRRINSAWVPDASRSSGEPGGAA